MAQRGDNAAEATAYVATARAYASDIAATLFLFIGTSLMVGRVWRFPFDDEIFTLNLIENAATRSDLTAVLHPADEHPSLGYLMFYWLHQSGLSEAGMRLCALLMTATALALFQVLTLMWIVQFNRTAAALPTRLIAALFFGLTPLA